MERDLKKELLNKGNIHLIPPYLMSQKDLILNAWEECKVDEHIFIFSSGTSSKLKLKSYFLSKDALFTNAKAVNSFLKATSQDSWLSTLPPYHIGGLSIYARASLLDSNVYEFPNAKWNVNLLCNLLSKQKISFFSIIPMQLYEIVQMKLKAPKSLKGVFVGGDFLATELANKAIDLGWPIIATYGMTELSSQIASSYYTKMSDGFLEVLPVHNIQGKYIYSTCLYSGLCEFNNDVFKITKLTGEFELPDSFQLLSNEKQYIKPLGRIDESIKLKGRLINFLDLKDTIHNIFLSLEIYGKIEVMLGEGENSHKVIDIYVLEKLKEREELIKNQVIHELPYLEGLLNFRYFDKLPKSAIGKIKRM